MESEILSLTKETLQIMSLSESVFLSQCLSLSLIQGVLQNHFDPVGDMDLIYGPEGPLGGTAEPVTDSGGASELSLIQWHH